MNSLEGALREVGLTQTEVAIYQAGLGRVGVTVQQLAHDTRIKRPTIYHAIETLMDKGLVAKRGVGNRLQFVMSPPDRLGHLLEQQIGVLEKRKTALDALLPLLAGRGDTTDTVQALQYEGIEGIKAVVEEALYCRSGHWDILAPRKNFFSDVDKAYADYFLSARKARGLTARSLWEEDPKRRVFSKEELRDRQPRILPKNMHGRFQSVIILFDDKVAVISSLGVSSAVIIQSKEMHATMLAIFDVLWDSSKPLV